MPLGTLDDALHMARQGVKVFPVRVTPDPTTPGKFTKTPLTPHGHLDATCDEAAIIAWDAPAFGAVAEHFVAMDLDTDKAWEEYLNRDPIITPLLPTLRKDGRHLYFRPFEGAWSGADVLPGVDIRGGGTGWVVLYGRWNLSEMAEAPEWFKRGRKTHDPIQRPAFPTDANGKIPHGQHHDWIVSVSASLASRTAGVNEPTLLRMVKAVLTTTLDDVGDHEAEIDAAVRSAFTKSRPSRARQRDATGGCATTAVRHARPRSPTGRRSAA